MELFLLLSSSFFLGAVHALEPGHGKMLVMSYLASSDRKKRDAFFLATAATLTHTFSILTLGAVVYFSASRLPGFVEHSLEVIAGFVIMCIGLWMLYSYKKSCGCGHHTEKSHETGRTGLIHIIGLGVSGGIVPCPASMAVLSTAVASGETLRGIMLIGMFSLGLGTLLFCTGLVFTQATGFLKKHITGDVFEKKARFFSALIIFILGLGLLTKSLLLSG